MSCWIVYTFDYLKYFYHITPIGLTSVFKRREIKAFNLSLYDLFDSSGIDFVALFCTRSILSTSLLLLDTTHCLLIINEI